MSSDGRTVDAKYHFGRPKVYLTLAEIARLVITRSKLGDTRAERAAEKLIRIESRRERDRAAGVDDQSSFTCWVRAAGPMHAFRWASSPPGRCSRPRQLRVGRSAMRAESRPRTLFGPPRCKEDLI